MFAGLFSGLLLATQAHAFGERSHEVVVQLASRFFTPEATQLVRYFYGTNYRNLLIADANWTAVNNRRSGNEDRLPFHYTWFEEGDTGFDPAQHCPQARCSVGAILAAERVLANPEQSRAQRMEAFRALLHYMGDLHDPTNAGFRHDRGGRDTIVVATDLRRVDLYAVWQTELYDYFSGQPFEIANAWFRDITPAMRAEWVVGAPQDWVWETHTLTRDLVYPLVDTAGGWNAIYRVQALPVYEEQLRKAAVRLADRMNRVAASLAAADAL